MKLIVGLGNPGKKYEKTRHNFGFMAIDFLREKYNAPNFKMNKKCNAEISKTDDFIFAKPQTFMNKSGEAVAKLLSFYKLTARDITVLHDDMDIEFGKIRESVGSRAAGHNGVQSIIDSVGTQDFKRIRLGVGRPPSFAKASDGGPANIPPEDYVLQNFPPEELEKIPDILKKISV